jgi:hypothetical protein
MLAAHVSEIGRFSRESWMAERDEQQVQLDFVQTLGLPDGAVAINGRVWFQDRQGLRAVFIEQTPFYTYSIQDTVEHRFCAAQLVESGLATAKRVCEVFQIAPRTLSRVRRQLRQGGIGGLVKGTPGPKTRRPRTNSVTPVIVRMYEEGQAPSQIAVQVGLSTVTIRRVLKDQGIALRGRGDAQQIDLFGAESPEAAAVLTGLAGAGQPGGEQGPEPLPRVAAVDREPLDAVAVKTEARGESVDRERPGRGQEPAHEGVEDGKAGVGDQAAEAVELGAAVAVVDGLDTTSEVGVGLGSCSSLVEPRCEATGCLDEAVEPKAPDIVCEGSSVWPEERPSGNDGGYDLCLAVARDVALSLPSAEPEGVWDAGLTNVAGKVEATSIPYAPPLDRLTTVLGMIEEAPVRFQTVGGVCGAGVLLGLALLDATHLLSEARGVYGRLKNSWYGLRSLLWTLVVMALLRIKRPEQLKHYDPASLGSVLGLPRAAEVKTIRRKLEEISERGRAAEFHRRLTTRRAAERASEMATLYVDGHVRVYHGKHRVGKTYVTRTKSVMRGQTDYWVHLSSGDPLLVIHDWTNGAFSQVMAEQVLPEIRRLVGKRRVRVVFDREGWSRELFWTLLDQGFDFLTYRKGSYAPVEESEFARVTFDVEGQSLNYELAEAAFEQEGWPRLRLIAVKKKNGGQTHILATGRLTWEGLESVPKDLEDYVDAPAAELAYWMFGRWCQENWFKYMIEQYALDVLVDYDVEPDDPERLVPNPQRRKLEAQVRAAREELQREQAKYARLVIPLRACSAKTKRKPCGPACRCVSCRMGAQETVVRVCEKKLERLRRERRATPEKIRLGDVHDRDPVKLSYERKLFTDIVKLSAYDIETRLYGMLPEDFRRRGLEGRSVIRDILQACGDLRLVGDTLEVHLEQMSAPRYTRAMQSLCEQLNAVSCTLPETPIRLRFFVKPRPVGE